MSVANLGHSAGSKIYGMVAEQTSYTDAYMLMSVLVVAMIIILFFHRHKSVSAANAGSKQHKTYTIGTGGGGAGIFFSGAIRCPKCEADMEQLEIEGTCIDRCVSCSGLWFDEGEIEVLSNKKTAALIDTGEVSVGKALNVIDHYPCPRCGGSMDKKVDSLQRHIWYETCVDCNGSFFDAGEFLDLSKLTISDVFKRLVTPKRN